MIVDTMSENNYIFIPAFSNSDLITEIISMMDIPIPDKYKLTNIQNRKIKINDDEELLKTLESLRYHGVKFIPKEVLHYIDWKIEDDRIDLSEFEDFLVFHFSKINDLTQYLIGTHENNNFELFKMYLKAIIKKDNEYKYRHFPFNNMFNFFSRKEILYVLNTYPEESKKYFDETSTAYDGMSAYYLLLVKRNMFDIFKILVEQIGTKIRMSSARWIIEKGNMQFVKYICEHDKKNTIPFDPRENPNSFSQRFVYHAFNSKKIEVIKYIIEEYNDNIISDTNICLISIFDDFEIVKYIVEKYNKPFTIAHKNEILQKSVMRGNLDIVKYLYERGCRFQPWRKKDSFSYELSKLRYDYKKHEKLKKIEACIDWVLAQ